MNEHRFADHLHDTNAHAAGKLHEHGPSGDAAAARLKETLPRLIGEAEDRLGDLLWRIQAPYRGR